VTLRRLLPCSILVGGQVCTILVCFVSMTRPGIPAHRKRLGDAVRKRRLSLELSQEELAERIDCHRNYVGSVERGEQNVTIDMLMRFTKALGCTLGDLVREGRC
jgi:DNA-binding XRE family transcriptional regulator